MNRRYLFWTPTSVTIAHALDQIPVGARYLDITSTSDDAIRALFVGVAADGDVDVRELLRVFRTYWPAVFVATEIKPTTMFRGVPREAAR